MLHQLGLLLEKSSGATNIYNCITAGAASLTLTVTDAQGKSSSQTAVINLQRAPAPVQHISILTETWTVIL